MYSRLILPLSILALLVLSSCRSESTSDATTNRLHISYSVIESEDEVLVSASFQLENALGTFLKLGDGDDLLVNGTKLTYVDFPDHHYEGALAAADQYDFEFSRAAEGVYVSSASSPLPVTITNPEPDSMVSRADGFVVTWEDTEESGSYKVGIVATGEYCTTIVNESVDGALTYEFTESDFLVPSAEGKCGPLQPGEKCAQRDCGDEEVLIGTLHVDSVRIGNLSPELSGVIDASSRSFIPLTLMP